MNKSLWSSVAAAVCLACWISDLVKEPVKTSDIPLSTLLWGGFFLIWLVISFAMYLVKEDRDSRSVTFIFWR